MKCAECGKEMQELESPGIQFVPTNEPNIQYPLKVTANLINLYGCADCKIKTVKTSPVDYYPNRHCCSECGGLKDCNCEGKPCTCAEQCQCGTECDCNEENGADKHI